jgi:hypothetical protein
MTTAERLEKLKSNFLKSVEGLNPDEKIVIGHGQEYKISYLIDCDVMCTEEGRIVEHKRKKYFIGHLSAGNNIGNRGHFHNEDCVSRITFDQHMFSNSHTSREKGYIHKLTDEVVFEEKISKFDDIDDDWD